MRLFLRGLSVQGIAATLDISVSDIEGILRFAYFFARTEQLLGLEQSPCCQHDIAQALAEVDAAAGAADETERS
jgi:hypothetical protein